MLRLARSLGIPVPSRRGGPIIDSLKPVVSVNARKRSLSAVFGLGPFPYHTDSANFQVPPRFVIIRLANRAESDRPTLFVDGCKIPQSAVERQILARDVWVVNGGRGRFYTSAFNDSLIPGLLVIRYDPCCMRPAIQSASRSELLLRSRCSTAPTLVMEWSPNRAVIFDNWRILHARGDALSSSESSRVLERILVARSAHLCS